MIKLRKQGYNVQCIFLADGESSRNIKDKNKLLKNIKNREYQASKVSKLLKFKRPKFFRLPDNKIDSIPLIKIIKIIEKEIKILSHQ